jgi:hypothetical protein
MSEAESVEADLLVPWLAAKAREQMRVQQNKFRRFIIISFAFLQVAFFLSQPGSSQRLWLPAFSGNGTA